VIKHAHHGFEPDQPGKDSYRLRKAGAQQMVVTSRERTALITEHPQLRDEPCLSDALAALRPATLDLVLVEGFKHETFPKIELYRAATGKSPLFPSDPSIIAVASDGSLDERQLSGLPHLPIDDPSAVADFVLARIGWRGTSASDSLTPR
jgi:molybdopterin-guanine dinucleotide biosynthesis protein MobB